MNWIRLLLCALLCALGHAVAGAGGASAHAFLVRSDPADGSRVERAPTQIRLEFDEPVELARDSVKVLSANGDRADQGTPATHGAVVTIMLRPQLTHGTYVVAWRLLSADGHLIAGAIQFGVGADPVGNQTITGSPNQQSLNFAASAARGVGYAGLVACAGVLLAGLWLWPWVLRRRTTQWLIGIGWLACVAAAVAQLLLLGPRAEGTGWSGVTRPSSHREIAASDTGQLQLVVLLLLAALPLAWLTRHRAWLLPVACVAVMGCVALSGHNSVGSWPWLAALAATVHLAAMAVWIGGLALLGTTVIPRLTNLRRVPARYLDRWSRTAFSCVALLVVTGEMLAWRQLEPLQSLWATSYGLILLAKISLVSVLAAVAWMARRQLLRQGTPPKPLVGLEMAVAAAILATTTFLVAQPPARTTYGPPYTKQAALGRDSVSISVDTTRRGPVVISAQLASRSNSIDLTASLTSPEAGIGALTVRLQRDPAVPGLWRSNGAVVPSPGQWTLTIKGAKEFGTATISYPVW